MTVIERHWIVRNGDGAPYVATSEAEAEGWRLDGYPVEGPFVLASTAEGAVALAPEVAAVAATLVDLMKRNLPPHISETQQVEAYLALKRIAGGR